MMTVAHVRDVGQRSMHGAVPPIEQQTLGSVRTSREKKDQGFTLVELLVVIITIGILAAIAIPVFLNQRNEGWDAQAKSDLRNMATAQESHLTDNGIYTAALADLTAVGFKLSADTSAHVAAIFTTGAADGYCLSVTSKSGQVWYHDSHHTIPAITPSGLC